MTTGTPLGADAAGAVAAIAAQRIAGYADRHHIPLSPQHCQDLAEQILHLYQAFHAGLHHTPPPGPGAGETTNNL